MVKLLLIAAVNPALDAVSLLEPIRLTLRSLNVARPAVFVERVVVPLSVPVPDDKVSVIEIPD